MHVNKHVRTIIKVSYTRKLATLSCSYLLLKSGFNFWMNNPSVIFRSNEPLVFLGF